MSAETDETPKRSAIAYRSMDGIDIALRSDLDEGCLDVLISAEARAQTLRVWVGGRVIYVAPATVRA